MHVKEVLQISKGFGGGAFDNCALLFFIILFLLLFTDHRHYERVDTNVVE
jgi:hypothetical protein